MLFKYANLYCFHQTRSDVDWLFYPAIQINEGVFSVCDFTVSLYFWGRKKFANVLTDFKMCLSVQVFGQVQDPTLFFKLLSVSYSLAVTI